MKKILIAISLLLTAHGLYAQESLTIEVKTAGTLGTLVQEANPNYLSEVKQLTLSGQLNGDDMAVLRNMAGCNDDEESAYYVGALRDLDMSEARIVEGGPHTIRNTVLPRVHTLTFLQRTTWWDHTCSTTADASLR